MENYASQMELNIWLQSCVSSSSPSRYRARTSRARAPPDPPRRFSLQYDRAQPDLRRADQAVDCAHQARGRAGPRDARQPPRPRERLLGRASPSVFPARRLQGLHHALVGSRWLPRQGLGGQEGCRASLFLFLSLRPFVGSTFVFSSRSSAAVTRGTISQPISTSTVSTRPSSSAAAPTVRSLPLLLTLPRLFDARR